MIPEDPYSDPTTGVLRNLLDIVDDSVLQAVERNVTFIRDESVRRAPLAGSFDLLHLRAYHRHLFGDVYAWAGQPRRVDIARVDAPFAHWRYIEPALEDLFSRLRTENLLADLDRTRFLAQFTHYFVEVNAVHPFREGNGRTQRAFFRHLAAHAGWRIEFAQFRREDYLEGCKAGMVGELGPLTDLFDSGLS